VGAELDYQVERFLLNIENLTGGGTPLLLAKIVVELLDGGSNIFIIDTMTANAIKCT